MADSKLSNLPAGTAIQDADLFYSDQSATSVSQPASAFKSYFKNSGTIRTILAANTNYYVAVGGSDSNNGLSPATAWATPQHAVNFISANNDFGGFTITVNCGVGTFVGADLLGTVGGGLLFVKGAGSANTTITDAASGLGCFTMNNGGITAIFLFDALTCKSSVSGSAGLYVQFGGSGAIIGNNLFNGTSDVGFIGNAVQNPTAVVNAVTPCIVIVSLGTFTVSSSWSTLWTLNSFAAILDFGSWVMSGTPIFLSATTSVASSEYTSAGASYTGAATGQRFNVNDNGTVIGAGSFTFFPGSSAGTVDASSAYDGIGGPIPGINTQTANYTFALSDALEIIEMNLAGANTVTVPLNATVAFPIGTRIWVTQIGAGATTIAGAGGVTVDNAGAVGGQWKSAKLYKRGTDEWVQTNA